MFRNINSNTTLVKVKLREQIHKNYLILDSNTTLVKVKSRMKEPTVL